MISKNGPYRGYFDNGVQYEENWKGGKAHGKSTYWHENGQIAIELNFKDGKEDGKFTRWCEDGQIEAQSNWKEGECISGDCDFFEDM